MTCWPQALNAASPITLFPIIRAQFIACFVSQAASAMFYVGSLDGQSPVRQSDRAKMPR
jgi:hypothetical protein